MSDTTDTLVDVLAPVLEGVGLGCYDVELVGPNRSRTLRVLVDRDGGVDLEAITAATKARRKQGDGQQRIEDADDDGIDVDVDGERRRVALGDVLQARTLFEWGPTPKSGGARGAASSRPDRPEPAVASAVSEDRR